MLIQQTREHLHTLRLTGMLQALDEQLEPNPSHLVVGWRIFKL
jgi:hypothetical protein